MKQWIGTALAPILKLWLATQVDTVENLQVKIKGNSGAILQGKIEGALVTGKKVTYQGLQFSYIALTAETIHLNIRQILGGEALRLLTPLEVYLHAEATAPELYASLQSELITNALGYSLDFPLSDQQLRSVLQELFAQISQDLQMDRLEVEEGNLTCKGMFLIMPS